MTESTRTRLMSTGIKVWPHPLRIEPDRDLPIRSCTFDVVCLFEVLEHIIDDPKHVFLEIGRILKNRGMLFLTTPNIAHIYNGFREPRGHFKEYTADELCVYLRNAFEIKEIRFLHCIGRQGLVSERLSLKILYYPYVLLCALRPSFRSTFGIICQKNTS